MTRALVVAAAFAAMALTAHADVWQDAISSADQTEQKYSDALGVGDDLALQATQVHVREVAREQVETAVTWYRAAAEIKPAEAEPYYRIGQVLWQAYFQWCPSQTGEPTGSPLCMWPIGVNESDVLARIPEARERGEQMLAAWDAFEARAPLDPRITSSFLFERAIFHTKMGNRDHWAAAARDYEKVLARDDFSDSNVTYHRTEGNLAETYMMLDRLDDAIDMYRLAMRHGEADALYGLAVTLDRNDETDLAKEYILDAGDPAFTDFKRKYEQGSIFFVPDGEKYYYMALIEEAFADYAALGAAERRTHADDALEDWRHYIASGAHPEFQPRAAAHIAALQKLPAAPAAPRPPLELDDE